MHRHLEVIHAVPKDEVDALDDVLGRNEAILPADGTNGEIHGAPRGDDASLGSHAVAIDQTSPTVRETKRGPEIGLRNPRSLRRQTQTLNSGAFLLGGCMGVDAFGVIASPTKKPERGSTKETFSHIDNFDDEIQNRATRRKSRCKKHSTNLTPHPSVQRLRNTHARRRSIGARNFRHRQNIGVIE